MIADFRGRKIESEGNPGGDMATPQKYRKKPVTIEAIQLNIHNVREVAKWCGADLGYTFGSTEPDALDIHTLEGTMAAYTDDYIIRGVHGEFYPCKPDIFKETYEAVQRGPSKARSSSRAGMTQRWQTLLDMLGLT